MDTFNMNSVDCEICSPLVPFLLSTYTLSLCRLMRTFQKCRRFFFQPFPLDPLWNIVYFFLLSPSQYYWLAFFAWNYGYSNVTKVFFKVIICHPKKVTSFLNNLVSRQEWYSCIVFFICYNVIFLLFRLNGGGFQHSAQAANFVPIYFCYTDQMISHIRQQMAFNVASKWMLFLSFISMECKNGAHFKLLSNSFTD